MRIFRVGQCAGLALMLVGACPRAAAQKLQSPWDLKPVTVTAGSYKCPALDPLPKNIEATSFYTDKKKSVVDPEKLAAYKAAQDQFDAAIVGAAKAADEFQSSGKMGAAECVLKILDMEAAAEAMTGTMSSNQAYYVQNWTLGALAVTWLKVRTAVPGTPDERRAALLWMQKVAGQVRVYFKERNTKGTNDGTNNHYYWAGFAVMGAAIAANDPGLYAWGAGTYDEALSRIKADGTLPLEMDRGQRALHYHLFALAPIVMMAEFGEANGQGFYAKRGGAVQLLVKRTVYGLIDNSYFTKASGVAQDTPEKGKDVKSTDVIWLVPYLKRFPDDNMNKVLHGTSLHPYNYIGGLPPAWK